MDLVLLYNKILQNFESNGRVVPEELNALPLSPFRFIYNEEGTLDLIYEGDRVITKKLEKNQYLGFKLMLKEATNVLLAESGLDLIE